MRLQLASAAAAASPVTVGNSGAFGGSSSVSGLKTVVDITDAATGTSTVVTAKIQAGAGTVQIMTGSLSGANFTVRAISPALTTVLGLNTFVVSLPVVAGDFIGSWWASTGQGRSTSTAGYATGYNASAPASLPTAGTVIALTTSTGDRPDILGTNP